MKKNIVAIIQARLGSSRLPLKSLLSLRESPIIDWVAQRVAKATKISKLVVAIPEGELDRVLTEHLDKKGIPWIAGPENDVLGRYVKAARAYDAEQVIRICADNPLVWGEAIDRLADFYNSGQYDYAYNHIPRGNSWPDGLGAEIVSRQTLEELNEKASEPAHREHCFNYIWANPDKFRIGTFNPAEKWLARPDIKLDIDSVADYRRLALMPLTASMDAREIINIWDKFAAGNACAD